nr:uncharacterized protein LOC109155364 [Ipomoea batatas]GME14789.1 uncharacterized protein LOC109155364 [Ipomoea batatas]GME19522.1 uncharacterized protein LOC109155364 [Ipomoea batatas]
MSEFNAQQRQAVKAIGMRCNALIESTQNGYAQSTILTPVDRIAELDWCGYLSATTMSYTDHLLVEDHIVPKNIPAFRGWTTKLLREPELREILEQEDLDWEQLTYH